MTLFWKTINCILNKKLKSKQATSEFKVNGGFITDPWAIANNFNNFFSEVGSSLAHKIPASNHSPLKHMNSPINNHFHFLPVTEDEVRETLINLKDSSPGYDNIDNSTTVHSQTFNLYF